MQSYSEHKIIQSPLNYTGGKFRLLGQILPLFPKKIDTFVDLFCGGCNVGVNVVADQVIFNDINTHLLCLYDAFRNLGSKLVLSMIDEIIADYNLSRSTDKGYDFYGCDSSNGLSKYNQKPYLELRNDYNYKNKNYNNYIMLYVLIVYAFNNQIRFNSKNEFNLPVGKRDFNNKMKSKLIDFVDRISENNFSFTNLNFRIFDVSTLTNSSLVYCDPPYLITCATYNENDGWNEQSECDLQKFLDDLHTHGIKFSLSNVLSTKGRTNVLLAEWSKKYLVFHLNHSYANSNYQIKNKNNVTDEILVVNYQD
ncbi:MAG: Dam family site-specific DNA-(adenine-N6)-methyltransferase [Deltaproteobacteria bacterium]|nr:Dam family site-specific DNA-(adenine-N6)-methyltransferase [Deltaproteobacteria bacterium]